MVLFLILFLGLWRIIFKKFPFQIFVFFFQHICIKVYIKTNMYKIITMTVVLKETKDHR